MLAHSGLLCFALLSFALLCFALLCFALQAYEDGEGPLNRPLQGQPGAQPKVCKSGTAHLADDGDESDEDTYEGGGVADGCAALLPARMSHPYSQPRGLSRGRYGVYA
jgi:hypothetical protein